MVCYSAFVDHGCFYGDFRQNRRSFDGWRAAIYILYERDGIVDVLPGNHESRRQFVNYEYRSTYKSLLSQAGDSTLRCFYKLGASYSQLHGFPGFLCVFYFCVSRDYECESVAAVSACAGCAMRSDGVWVWSLDLCVDNQVQGSPVCPAVSDSVMDVRDADCLSGVAGRKSPMEIHPVAQSDDGGCGVQPLRIHWQRSGRCVGTGIKLAGDHIDTHGRRVALQQSSTNVCGYDMNDAAISVHKLSKCYRLGTIGRHTLVDEVSYWWHKVRGRDPRKEMGRIGHTATEARRVEAEQGGQDRFWALKDVSFDIQPGEVVGIIGRNGAGKSTLLKILSRITEPTEGKATINGRVGSLLEVGTGFHPELTGRENVYMNGAILGMKKHEIAAKFDEIVSFAEMEKFIDTPVKRYSSGMYVRLAFAVAAHLETEIILVDEVLAVGDVIFQKKCLGKMKDVAGAGRTVLFVSHNMSAIRNLCSRVLLIDQGRLALDSDADRVITRYLDRNLIKGSVASESEINNRVEGARRDYPYFKITEIRLEDTKGVTKSVFDSTEPIVVRVSFKCFQRVYDFRIIAAAADENGAPIYGSQSTDDCEAAEMFYVVEAGNYVAKCIFPSNIFSHRKYYLNVQALYPRKEDQRLAKILEFEVDFKGYNPNIQYCGNNWDWFIWQKLPWSLKKLN